MTHEWFTPHAQKALAERGVDWRRYARSFHAGLSFDPTFSALVDRTLGMGCMGGVAARKLEHMGASLYHDLMSIGDHLIDTETRIMDLERANGVAEKRIAELEAALHDLVAVAAANMGGLCGINNVPYPKHHVAIINTAQRLLGGREIPND